MSDEKLRWAFELVDKMTGSATKMNRALVTVKKTLEDGSVATVRFEKALGAAAATGKAGPWGAIAGGALAIGAAMVSVAGAVAYAGVEFGKFAIDALAFKESTLASFKLMLGTKEKAREIFDEALAFGKLTPFETQDVVTSYKQLLSAGFTKQEVPIVFQALGDVAAASGFNKEAIGMITTQLAQVKGVGKLQMVDLKQIIGWTAPAGVGLNKVYEQIAKVRGISAKAVPALLSGGQIKSDEGIFAIISAIKEASGGKVGNQMLAQATTIKGLYSTIASIGSDFFMSMDLDKLEGLDSYKGLLKEIIRVFDTGSATGQRLQAVLRTIVNEGLEGLFGGAAGRLEGLFNAMVTGIERGWQVMKLLGVAGKEFWLALKPSLERIGPVLGKVFGDSAGAGDALVFVAIMAGRALGIMLELALVPMRISQAFHDLVTYMSQPALILADLLKWPERLGQAFHKFATAIGTTFVGIGKAIGDGLKLGLQQAAGGPTSALLGFLGGFIGTAKAELGVHSPSRVFAEIGRNTMQGYELGVEQAEPAARAATTSAVAPPQLAAHGVLRGSTTNTVTVPITINVEGGGDAHAVARELEEMLPAQLAVLFRRLATESGA